MSNNPAFVMCGGNPDDYADVAISTMEHLPCGVLSLSAGGTIEFFNGRLFDRFPISLEDLSIGMSLEDFIHLIGPHFGWSDHRQERVIASHYAWMKKKEATVLNHHFNDNTVLSVGCQPRPDGGGVLTFLDSSDPSKEVVEIRKYAFHDPLTEIMNRRSLEDRFTQMQDDGSMVGKALLLVDLDMFKDVNDTYGHAIGDAVLVEVVQRMQDIVQDDDRLFRLGGDEMVIFPQQAGNGAARTIGEEIVRACSEPMSIEGLNIGIGASVGIAHAVPGDCAGTFLARPTLRFMQPKIRVVGAFLNTPRE